MNYSTGKSCTRILCPECLGHKTKLYPTPPFDEPTLQKCQLCAGEGLVDKIVNIIYKKII